MPQTYDNTIHQQDCITGMREVADESADIIIADPPYNIGKDFGNSSDRRPLGEYISWSKQWLAECERILKPTGTMFIYGFAEILAHISVMLPIERQRWLQWHYANKNMPGINFWQRSHESILCIWKKNPVFNQDEVREPYTQSFLAGCAGRIRPYGACRMSGKKAKATIYQAHAKGAMPRDVLSVPALAGGAALRERSIYCKSCGFLVEPNKRKLHSQHQVIIHPTQKPLALTEKLLLSCKPSGNFNVLVPFCGSGSECKCTLYYGGNFLSYELNSDYIELARAIIKNIIE